METRPDHRRDPAEDGDRDRRERVPRGRSGVRLRHRAGRRRLPERPARHHAAHGGVPGRAGVLRCRADHRLAGLDDEDCGGRARRHRDGVDRRELAAENPGGAARASHDAGHADSVVLRRSDGELESEAIMDAAQSQHLGRVRPPARSVCGGERAAGRAAARRLRRGRRARGARENGRRRRSAGTSRPSRRGLPD